MALSERQKIQQLLNTETLGHRKPTQSSYLPTPPIGQDMAQSQFLSGV